MVKIDDVIKLSRIAETSSATLLEEPLYCRVKFIDEFGYIFLESYLKGTETMGHITQEEIDNGLNERNKIKIELLNDAQALQAKIKLQHGNND